MVDLVNTAPPGTFNQLEQLSAYSNQASYNVLTANPQGTLYCDPRQTAASKTCPKAQYLLFANLRELVQSANELLNNGGPTQYSLHTDNQGLGFALRWTAGEDLAAPGSVSTQFANGQLSSVAGRLAALRFGASGFALSGLNLQQDGRPIVALNEPVALGGGASADSDIGIASRWGGFLNGAFGWGYRQPSVLEDAFAFDSTDVTLGVDYRFTPRFVLGFSGSYNNQRVDFDTERSVAGGGFRAHGYGIMFYGIYEWEGPYITASAGWQRADLNETRLITYPSDNLAVPSTNATAKGSTHTDSVLASLSAGWSFTWHAAGVEPYITADYRHVNLAGFSESSYENSGPDAGQEAGFDFNYAPEHFQITDSAVGLRLQYTFTPSFGVIVPYARAEYHHEFGANAYTVTSTYNAISGSGAQFDLPTDPADTHFYVFSGGFSVVLKHGLQGFAQYQTSSGMTYVTSRLISGGIRVEF
ncbi:MAG TPA: autotransporter outer membrane beta-barrel domain-containing protein [Steroidobacteraceae bacterium]|nr:autotransporter outer membrane beta-barrel domain-containing protein [Steroidobacteraceae bacterium]